MATKATVSVSWVSELGSGLGFWVCSFSLQSWIDKGMMILSLILDLGMDLGRYRSERDLLVCSSLRVGSWKEEAERI